MYICRQIYLQPDIYRLSQLVVIPGDYPSILNEHIEGLVVTLVYRLMKGMSCGEVKMGCKPVLIACIRTSCSMVYMCFSIFVR